MKTGKNILICPLEWGLGHAARMIPMAQRLQELGNNVIIGAGEKHLALFRAELPGLTFLNFPGFSPSYSKVIPQYMALMLQFPALLYHFIKEHHDLKDIIKEHEIDIIISDNRFGLWNSRVRSVYVTHILKIPTRTFLKPLEYAGMLLHKAIISRFDLCLIPDLPGELNLSGDLSHLKKLHRNTIFAGILSRFQVKSASTGKRPESPYGVVILSGPEPQRGILKRKLEEVLLKAGKVIVFLEGKPGEESDGKNDKKFVYYAHMKTDYMKDLLQHSDFIISRSGYSTIMDLAACGRGAILIPTPGQTEQEYLAKYLSGKGWFNSFKQSDTSVIGLDSIQHWSMPGEILRLSGELFEKALEKLLEED